MLQKKALPNGSESEEEPENTDSGTTSSNTLPSPGGSFESIPFHESGETSPGSSSKTSTNSQGSSDPLPNQELTAFEKLLHEVFGAKTDPDPNYLYNIFETLLNLFCKDVLKEAVKKTWMTEFFVKIMLEKEKQWKKELQPIFDAIEMRLEIQKKRDLEIQKELNDKSKSIFREMQDLSFIDLNEKARAALQINSPTFYCIDKNGFIDGCFIFWLLGNANNFKEQFEHDAPETLEATMKFIQKNILQARGDIEMDVGDVKELPFPIHPELQEVMKIILGLANESVIRCNLKMSQGGSRNILGVYGGEVLKELKNFSPEAKKFIEEMLKEEGFIEKPASSYLSQGIALFKKTAPPKHTNLTDDEIAQILCNQCAGIYANLLNGVVGGRCAIEKIIQLEERRSLTTFSAPIIATLPRVSDSVTPSTPNILETKANGPQSSARLLARTRERTARRDEKSERDDFLDSHLIASPSVGVVSPTPTSAGPQGSARIARERHRKQRATNEQDGKMTARVDVCGGRSLEDLGIQTDKTVRTCIKEGMVNVREMQIILPKNCAEEQQQIILDILQPYYTGLLCIDNLLKVLKHTLLNAKTSEPVTKEVRPGVVVKELDLRSTQKSRPLLEELEKLMKMIDVKMRMLGNTPGVEKPVYKSLDYLGYDEPAKSSPKAEKK